MESEWMDRCIVKCGVCESEVYSALHLHAIPLQQVGGECINICGPCLAGLVDLAPPGFEMVALQRATQMELMAEDEMRLQRARQERETSS